ncbi:MULTISPECIES: SDR family NAD(P)-dependent oxidoreductase [unclassified Amycolatopsis]|uniref:SDR family NAD(P)-dependent oxidoreductase n=1 Tax=unclassified Amycolatopsis TaxID=2618356 RepID=UPI003454EEDE
MITALVSGANKGLGREIARGLARRGATVLLGSRDLALGEKTAAELRAEGLAVTPVRLDVTSAADIDDVAHHLETRHGRLDVLVNNAGARFSVEPAELTAEHLRRAYETNLFSVAAVTHRMLNLLRAAEAPHVVNVASTSASLALTTAEGSQFAAATDTIAYSSSKTALVMLTIRYATTFRADPAYAHFHVNAVTPGFIASDLNGHTGPRTAEQGARVVLDLVAQGAAAPTGMFLNEDGPVPW